MKRLAITILAFTMGVTAASAASEQGSAARTTPTTHGDHGSATDENVVARVRSVTERYLDINQALNAGYGRFLGCVSGAQEGAMGVHFVNPALVDGELDLDRPEALIYEFKNGYARLVGVEYITPAALWDAAHADAPVLGGQLLQYNGSPNRYRLPGFYELHVWAWRNNPSGAFADWNPRVSCAESE